MLNIFAVCVAVHISLSVKCLPLSNYIVFLLLSSERSLYILNRSHFLNMFYKYLLPTCSLHFSSVNRAFHRVENFNFDEIQSTTFFLILCKSKNSSVNPRSWRIFLCFFPKILWFCLTFICMVHFVICIIFGAKFRLKFSFLYVVLT